jgi:hypothetical protein
LNSEKFYRGFWIVAGIFNVIGGLGIFIFAEALFGTVDKSPPVPPLYYQAWIAMFATIGIGYWIVALDLYKNRGMVYIGIIGKLAFASLCFYNAIAYPGQIPPFLIGAAVADVTFVLFFWRFLGFQKKGLQSQGG